jgi:hypothetical protein
LSAALYAVDLTAPPAGAPVQGEVKFSWVPRQARLPDGYLYELVFWNPNQSGDKRGPNGVTAALSNQFNVSDILASENWPAFLRAGQEFCWGVRAWDAQARKESVMLNEDCARRIVYSPERQQASSNDNPRGPSQPVFDESPEPINIEERPEGGAP